MSKSAYFPRHAEPLVAQSPFQGRAYQATLRNSFAEARPLLPEPVLPDQPQWVEMYWRAWELTWQHIQKARPGAGFVADYLGGADLKLEAACYALPFGVYGRRAFSFTSTLDNFYAKQHEDGLLCRQIRAEDGADRYHPFDPNGTGPNILAWAEWRHYRASGDIDRLSEIFSPLFSYHRWCRANRTWPSGLYWGTAAAGGRLGEGHVPNGRFHHRHWTWLDANLQASISCLALGQMAAQIDKDAYAAELEGERQQLLRLITERLWQEDSEFYFDVDPAGKPGQLKSLAAYWALLDRGLSAPPQLEGLLRHIRSDEAFARPFPLPGVAALTPGYDEHGGSARGGVVSAMTYVVIKGLRQAGQYNLSHELARRHLEHVCTVFERTDTFWSRYAAETAAPGNEADPDDTTTAGLAAIALLFEDVIGLHVDWPLRRVVWDRRLSGDGYGVRNYPLGASGRLTLIALEGVVHATTDVPFTLTVQDENGSVQLALPAGTTEIPL